MGGVKIPTPIYVFRRRGSSGQPENLAEIRAKSFLPIRYGDVWVSGRPASGVGSGSFAAYSHIDIHTLKTFSYEKGIFTLAYSGTYDFTASGRPQDIGASNNTIALLFKSLLHANSPVGAYQVPMLRLLVDNPYGAAYDGNEMFQGKALIYLPSPGEQVDALLEPALASTVLSIADATGGAYRWPTTIAENPWWDRFGAVMLPMVSRSLRGPIGVYDINLEVDFDLTLTSQGQTSTQTLTPTATRFIRNTFTPEVLT